MAWQKPVYVLTSKPASAKLPPYLAKQRVFPVSKLDDVILQLKRPSHELSPDKVTVLKDLYSEVGVPSDQLMKDPARLERFSREFNSRARTKISGERLMSELLRLRKGGHLPRISVR
jgi:hypothetical protein